MKIKVIKVDKVLTNLRPTIKVGDEFEVVSKGNYSDTSTNNPCYLVYDSTGAPISLYHHEIEEIKVEEIKPKKIKA